MPQHLVRELQAPRQPIRRQSNYALYLQSRTAAGGIIMNQKKSTTYDLVITAMLTAIVILLGFTPLGLIDLPLIKATILHIPVILGSLLLGWRKGAFLGAVFGAVSLIKNTMAPSVLSFAFSPFMPVPGLDHGSPWALVICFIPRILVGITPDLIYRGSRRLFGHKNAGVKTVCMVVAAIVGAFTNTVLVMGLIFVIFRSAYAAANGITVDAVLGVILGVVASNGIPEAIVAAVITPALGMPLSKVLKLDKA